MSQETNVITVGQYSDFWKRNGNVLRNMMQEGSPTDYNGLLFMLLSRNFGSEEFRNIEDSATRSEDSLHRQLIDGASVCLQFTRWRYETYDIGDWPLRLRISSSKLLNYSEFKEIQELATVFLEVAEGKEEALLHLLVIATGKDEQTIADLPMYRAFAYINNIKSLLTAYNAISS